MNDFGILGHMIIAMLTGLAFTHNIIGFICWIFGNILPDIDTRRSTLGRYNPFAYWMTHRGHCHSFLGIIFLSLPFVMLGITNYEYVLMGAVTHLLSDKLLSWFPKKQYFKLKIW